jgi:hypothetical protein
LIHTSAASSTPAQNASDTGAHWGQAGFGDNPESAERINK